MVGDSGFGYLFGFAVVYFAGLVFPICVACLEFRLD